MRALSIQQPWAWLIVNGHKAIENRDWRTGFRGPLLIHAGQRYDKAALADIAQDIHPVTGERATFNAGCSFSRGGIVGVVDLIDCVSASDDPWFVGRYGFVLANARPLPFRPMRGKLGIFWTVKDT